MPPKNIRPHSDAQKRIKDALDFNSRRVSAVREYRECKAAKEPNLSDKKAKRKEVGEEKNKIQERIEEAKKLPKEMCAAGFWHGRRSTRHRIGSPTGAKIKATLQAPLLESTHEAMAASRR